jgi:hypothetical protein
MTMKASAFSGAALKRAIEQREARTLSGFYADDALLRVIDRNNPPSHPREIKGRAAIDGQRLAFTQSCGYPDGTRVFLLAMLDLKGGKIARHVVVQAWDE